MSEDNLFPGARGAAVSFTYDDALHVHLDHAMPDLEAVGLRGSFYVPTHNQPNDAWQDRKSDWRAAIARGGHELGNHTQYHPCSGILNWVKPERRLETYDLDRIERELLAANRELAEGAGVVTPVSFAYTCAHDWVGPERTSFRPVVGRIFPAARVGDIELTGPFVNPHNLDFTAIGSIGIVEDHSLADLKRSVDLAIQRREWLVFMFHGVGGEHRMNILRKNHIALVEYVAGRSGEIWCDTFLNISQHIRKITNRPWKAESPQ